MPGKKKEARGRPEQAEKLADQGRKDQGGPRKEDIPDQNPPGTAQTPLEAAGKQAGPHGERGTSHATSCAASWAHERLGARLPEMNFPVTA